MKKLIDLANDINNQKYEDAILAFLDSENGDTYVAMNINPINCSYLLSKFMEGLYGNANTKEELEAVEALINFAHEQAKERTAVDIMKEIFNSDGEENAEENTEGN